MIQVIRQPPLLGLRAERLIDNNQTDPIFLGMSLGLLELKGTF